MPVSELEEIHIYANSYFTENSFGHRLAQFCDVLKKHSIITWRLLRSMRGKDAPNFTKSITELVAAIGCGDGAEFIFKGIIDEAYKRVTKKPVSSSDFANWLRGQMILLLANQPEKIAPALATIFSSDGSLPDILGYHLDNAATGSTTLLCPYCLARNVTHHMSITPPLNRANILKHFDSQHFNGTLLPKPRRAIGDPADAAQPPSPSLSASPAPSPPPVPAHKKQKRAAASSAAPAPLPPSSPSAPARSTSGTGPPSQL